MDISGRPGTGDRAGRGSSSSRPGGAADRLLRLGRLPVAVMVLTGLLAAYMALVAFGNITDFGSNRAFVQHVLAMDTTFRDPDLMWRAVGSPTLVYLAYVGIIVWEVLTAAVLTTATVLHGRGLRSGLHERARRATTLGLLMLMLLFGLGFLVIGGEWFAMWQSTKWNGLEPAGRNFTLAGIVLLLVHLPSRQWGPTEGSEA
ncbi:DUF2165 domain-containing protein [Streptomyces sp. NPDC098789]|uniref:DUF2165 domain-containing protein n=1 Tax=Streptomyces sp. NPDC098789 TaxID=3366098 RepID=UPI0038204FCA